MSVYEELKNPRTRFNAVTALAIILGTALVFATVAALVGRLLGV